MTLVASLPDDLRSIPEAAALALVTQPTVRNWMDSGELPFVVFHRHRYVREADLYRVMQAKVFRKGKPARAHYPELADKIARQMLGRSLRTSS